MEKDNIKNMTDLIQYVKDINSGKIKPKPTTKESLQKQIDYRQELIEKYTKIKKPYDTIIKMCELQIENLKETLTLI